VVPTFSADDPAEISSRAQVEDDNRHFVIHAQRNRRRVHDLEAAFEHL
jgi:hypothetical protein